MNNIVKSQLNRLSVFPNIDYNNNCNYFNKYLCHCEILKELWQPIKIKKRLCFINKATFCLLLIITICASYPLYAKTLIDDLTGIAKESLSVYEPNTKDLNKEIVINNKKYSNIWQYCLSENKEHLITLELNDNHTQIKKYNLKNSNSEIINNDKNIKYSPVINNKGNFAYVSYLNINNNFSKIYLDGKEIDSVKNTVYLNIDDNSLYIAELDIFKKCKPYKYNIQNGTKEFLKFPDNLQITKFVRFSNNRLLLEAYSSKDNRTKTYVYDFTTQILQPLSTDQDYYTEIIHEVTKDSIVIDSISNFEGQIYTYLKILSSQSQSLRISKSNNENGMLTWALSVRLEFLINFYLLSKNPLIQEHLTKITENIFAKQNSRLNVKGQFINPEGWSSKIYSVDKKTDVNLLVDDAKILYPLLLLYSNSIIKNEKLKKNILDTAIKTFNYYEKDYNNGHYIATKNSPYKYDGLSLPWNQQNAFGLCCIELFKITKDKKYKQRAIDLAKSFNKEIIYNKNKIIWNYNPIKLHNGWKKSDNISKNSPMKKKTSPKLEDTSHAGINVKFILEIQKNFPNEVFNEKDIDLLNQTANSMYDKNKGFYPRLYLEKSLEKASFESNTLYGWSETNSEFTKFLIDYYNKGNLVLNDFELTILFIACNNFDKKISITRKIYDINLKSIESSTKTITLAEYISDYCGY